MIKLVEIDRIVTILDSVTGEDVKKPLHCMRLQVATWQEEHSSAILKKVKDPNLIGSLSGHKEGSKAFAT